MHVPAARANEKPLKNARNIWLEFRGIPLLTNSKSPQVISEKTMNVGTAANSATMTAALLDTLPIANPLWRRAPLNHYLLL